MLFRPPNPAESRDAARSKARRPLSKARQWVEEAPEVHRRPFQRPRGGPPAARLSARRFRSDLLSTARRQAATAALCATTSGPKLCSFISFKSAKHICHWPALS